MSPSTTSYAITGLTNGISYVCKVTCLDTSGGESEGRVVYTGLPAQAQADYTIQIDALDTSAFPLVTLDLSVLDAESGPVDSLTQDDIFIVSAGQYYAPEEFSSPAEGSYTLTYTDTTCGHRSVYAYVLCSDGDETHAGLSLAVSFGRSLALLVGIDDYLGIDDDLEYCINDVDDLRSALEVRNMWSGAGASFTVLTDSAATRSAVRGALATLAQDMDSCDLLLFHYSGHGSSSSGRAYLCTYWDDESYSLSDWISSDDLADYLADVPNPGNGLANVIVLLDSCYSGGFIARATDVILHSRYLAPPKKEATGDLTSGVTDICRALSANNIFVITAASATESSFADDNLRNGFFTYYLTQGLGLDHENQTASATVPELPANSDGDGCVSAEEAFAYLATEVVNYMETHYSQSQYSQTPQVSDNSADTICRLLQDAW